jgi:hypothetical protein
MLTLIEWGGFPVWFVLLFGFISLGAAAFFVRKPERRQLGLVIGMSVATLFSILNGVAADLATVGHALNVKWDKFYTADHAYQGVVQAWGQGFAESLSPAIIGFTLLSLTWLVAAVGLRRMTQSQAA